MKNFITTTANHYLRQQFGFTLVELLVVVGIIVALSAVIVPNVAQFSNRGAEGAQASEAETIQTAMDNMMADVGIDTVVAQASPALSVKDFTAEPAAAPQALVGYLRSNPTTYFYCWNAAGLITAQHTASAACP